MCATQPVVLPATSVTRVSTMCSPWPLTTAVPVSPAIVAGVPSIFQSTWSTPEPGATSVPLTVTFTETAACQALEIEVWSTGQRRVDADDVIGPAGDVAVAVRQADTHRVDALAADRDR